MKLTAQIKLDVTPEQHEALLKTMEEVNAACNEISAIAWEKKQFGKFKLHHLVYRMTRDKFKLSAQVVVRAIAKVSDGYRLNRKKQRFFRKHGCITYDNRILTYRFDKGIASIWTLGGRVKIKMIISDHHKKLLAFQQGESDLCFRKDKWYLLATCDVPSDEERQFEDVLGIDVGITALATDSTGESFSGEQISNYRDKRNNIRKSLQSKARKGASRSTIKNTRRLLKRLSGKEARTARIINHTISKRIVEKAIETNRAIALENLKGIRKAKVRKKQRRRHNSWPFYQLKAFIMYKAERAGVTVFEINPAYTSKTCSSCFHIGVRSGKHFKCTNCGNEMDSDHNAAINIATWGRIVNRPENSAFVCCLNTHCA